MKNYNFCYFFDRVFGADGVLVLPVAGVNGPATAVEEVGVAVTAPGSVSVDAPLPRLVDLADSESCRRNESDQMQ